MGRKSSIKTLPKETLARLNALIAEGNVTLEELTAWLEERGHKRSRSAVHRYAQEIERVQARLRQSREITEAVARELGDAATQGKQGRLLVEMTRGIVFDLLMKLQEASDEEGKAVLDPRDVAFLGKGLAELGRALRFDQDFEQQIRQAAAKEAAEQAATRVDDLAAAEGISKKTREAWRREVLGIGAAGSAP